MTTVRLLALSWSPDPSVLGGTLALGAAYLAWLRGRPGARAVPFAAGLLVLVLALTSPLHTLGELYLFSAHMAQHLLLLLVVPPLLLWGLPPAATARLLRRPALERLESTLGRPALAFTVATAALWAWHLPALYDRALLHHGLHVGEHLVFLVTATMFWWPLLQPRPAHRLAAGPAMGYLAGALVSGSLLGILLTFAPAGTYPFYLHPPDPFGALTLIRDGWGLTPAVDQQLGGILMWVPGGAVYIAGILVLFGRWMSGADAADHSGPATTGALPRTPPEREDGRHRTSARGAEEAGDGAHPHRSHPSPPERAARGALEGAP